MARGIENLVAKAQKASLFGTDEFTPYVSLQGDAVVYDLAVPGRVRDIKTALAALTAPGGGLNLNDDTWDDQAINSFLWFLSLNVYDASGKHIDGPYSQPGPTGPQPTMAGLDVLNLVYFNNTSTAFSPGKLIGTFVQWKSEQGVMPGVPMKAGTVKVTSNTQAHSTPPSGLPADLLQKLLSSQATLSDAFNNLQFSRTDDQRVAAVSAIDKARLDDAALVMAVSQEYARRMTSPPQVQPVQPVSAPPPAPASGGSSAGAWLFFGAVGVGLVWAFSGDRK